MAKLVVDNLNELSGLKSTAFFRIFGQITNYDNSNGILKIKSLFDNSTCDIELSLENHKTLAKLQNGLVVDIQVVRKLSKDLASTVLLEQQLDVLMFPGILLENKETLLQVAELKSLKTVKLND